jgi:hypothetical protein
VASARTGPRIRARLERVVDPERRVGVHASANAPELREQRRIYPSSPMRAPRGGVP